MPRFGAVRKDRQAVFPYDPSLHQIAEPLLPWVIGGYCWRDCNFYFCMLQLSDWFLGLDGPSHKQQIPSVRVDPLSPGAYHPKVQTLLLGGLEDVLAPALLPTTSPSHEWSTAWETRVNRLQAHVDVMQQQERSSFFHLPFGALGGYLLVVRSRPFTLSDHSVSLALELASLKWVLIQWRVPSTQPLIRFCLAREDESCVMACPAVRLSPDRVSIARLVAQIAVDTYAQEHLLTLRSRWRPDDKECPLEIRTCMLDSRACETLVVQVESKEVLLRSLALRNVPVTEGVLVMNRYWLSLIIVQGRAYVREWDTVTGLIAESDTGMDVGYMYREGLVLPVHAHRNLPIVFLFTEKEVSLLMRETTPSNHGAVWKKGPASDFH